MTSVVFYFQVHQPYRLLRTESFAGRGDAPDYFDDEINGFIMRRVAERCYLPMNEVIRNAIEETDGRFRCAYAISGTALSQMEEWAPEALESFQELGATGCVEFVAETAYHSLAALADLAEFDEQVRAQAQRLHELFGQRPTSFRNTELIFDDGIARRVEELGFRVLLAEGADQLLGERSARRVYQAAGCRNLRLLLRDYLFSDDIAFRFSNREWPQYPLMADTFADWLHRSAEDEAVIGLFMDYETFGEHQAADTGILDFMARVPGFVLEDSRFSFRTPAEAADTHAPREVISAPRAISWADAERDISAWLGNPMQKDAHARLYGLRPGVERAARLGHPELLEAWRKLTTSDHVYYMSTKWYSDGDVHEYFTPYESPVDSFVVFMNVLDDLSRRVQETLEAPRKAGEGVG